MRAVGVTEFGGPEALHIVDVPAEPLGPGQVRLRVQAATVNPTDTHARSGAYADRDPVKTPPWVPGMDVAGVVTEVGAGVDHLEVGDPAMGIVFPFGPYGGTARTRCCRGTPSSVYRRASTSWPRRPSR
jgi:NADPH2:quinone reductase